MVEFVGSEYTVSEGDGEVQVCLRIAGQVADEAIVRLITSPDTAEGSQLHARFLRPFFKPSLFFQLTGTTFLEF